MKEQYIDHLRKFGIEKRVEEAKRPLTREELIAKAYKNSLWAHGGTAVPLPKSITNPKGKEK